MRGAARGGTFEGAPPARQNARLHLTSLASVPFPNLAPPPSHSHHTTPPPTPVPQYRMHPSIREFPSTNFYGGNLKDGPNVAADTQRPWHSSPAFQPLVFIDVKGTVGGGGGGGGAPSPGRRHPQLRAAPHAQPRGWPRAVCAPKPRAAVF